ncbi:STAS domain-containing protein [Caulobacter sp. S45]|jgi:chemotaxis protein CheX|uniref:STAS domain-containing protein n=1 Tax=Caulobacter sp. S45 TaxID=1641861 RepID=UPI00131C7382|nr:STAS domain-containing protein [Caulobacter sp. S45]
METAPPATLALPDVLDLKATSHLVADLLALRGHDLELDASGVQRLGGQCLQVLLSATAAWKQDGAVLTVRQPSDAFREGLQLMGAEARLIPELAQ